MSCCRSCSSTRRRRWRGWCTGRSPVTCRLSGKKIKMGDLRTCLPVRRRRSGHHH
uniref:Uncharacterized protein n=1 Tax=Arundo donax TaxID=35708 RepID=A0A0A9FRR2_ARUDO